MNCASTISIKPNISEKTIKYVSLIGFNIKSLLGLDF